MFLMLNGNTYEYRGQYREHGRLYKPHKSF